MVPPEIEHTNNSEGSEIYIFNPPHLNDIKMPHFNEQKTKDKIQGYTKEFYHEGVFRVT